MRTLSRAHGHIDLLAIRDEVRKYLAERSIGRQGAIADIIGVRRETICLYSKNRLALNDIRIVDKLYQWMIRDRQQ